MNRVADNTDTLESLPDRRRWRPWRWLIAGIAIVLLIATAIPMTLAYRAEQALARMRAAGGEVQIYAAPPRSRGWLDRAWSDIKQELPEGFQCLDPELEVSVLFERSSAIDDQWLVDHDFSSLPCRILIGIYHPDITDVGIRALAGIRQLEGLFVDRTRLTDDGLKMFAGHENLSMLGLHSTEVTAAGLPALATLPRLRHLDVSGTDITGDELCQLRTCSRLESFHVDPNQLTASLASELRHFPRLRAMSIRSSRISLPGWPETQPSTPCDDATLSRLLSQTKIVHLSIHDGREVTDTSVAPLLAATHLRHLSITDAGISHAGALKVNAAHPQAVGTPAVQLASESSGH